MKKKKKKIQFTQWEELIAFPADERAVFHCIANCEVSSSARIFALKSPINASFP